MEKVQQSVKTNTEEAKPTDVYFSVLDSKLFYLY